MIAMIAMMLGCLLAAGAPAASFRIAGVVLNAVSRQPVAGARVTLAPVERSAQQLALVTGADGRFAFAGIPAGKYELTGQRRGLLTQSYDQRAGFASAIVTGAGQDTENMVLTLTPPAVVSGKIVDDGGEPVEHALVELLSSRIVGGRRRLANFASQQTDDLGEYRFSPVPPGTYYLAASGYPWYTKFNETMGDAAPRNIAHTGYGPRYYPNVSDPAEAEPLVLKAGQEAAANLSLLPEPAVSVSVHFENGEDLAKQLTLTAAGLPGHQVFVREGTESGDSYNFWGVPPGHYILRVQAPAADRTLYAKSVIDVGATDTEASVTLLEAPSGGGTIEWEGGASLPPGAMVLLTDEETGRVMQAAVGPDRKFSFPAIAPQRYRLSLARADECYLKSWTVEGARRDDETLDIGEGSAVRMKLAAAKGAGRIHGTVERDGHPQPGVLVVLAPDSGGQAGGQPGGQAGEHRALQSDSDGSYEFRGLPPGGYALFAVAGGAELEYANPAAIRPYLGSAEKVRVAAGGSYTQRLELGAAPKN